MPRKVFMRFPILRLHAVALSEGSVTVARPPWMDQVEAENRLRGMGRKAVAQAHAAGVSACIETMRAG